MIPIVSYCSNDFDQLRQFRGRSSGDRPTTGVEAFEKALKWRDRIWIKWSVAILIFIFGRTISSRDRSPVWGWRGWSVADFIAGNWAVSKKIVHILTFPLKIEEISLGWANRTENAEISYREARSERRREEGKKEGMVMQM